MAKVTPLTSHFLSWGNPLSLEPRNDSLWATKMKAQGTGASVRVEGEVVESPAKGHGHGGDFSGILGSQGGEVCVTI